MYPKLCYNEPCYEEVQVYFISQLLYGDGAKVSLRFSACCFMKCFGCNSNCFSVMMQWNQMGTDTHHIATITFGKYTMTEL